MYKTFIINDTYEWLNIINSFKEADVYYHPGYLKAFQENGDGQPVLFYLESIYGRVINVFLKRDLYDDERLRAFVRPDEFCDISTVYGYGGPIFDSIDFYKLSECYSREFEKYCRNINAVAEFIRFHPVLKNHSFVENSYDVRNIRSTVYMDLSGGEESVWENLESNCKRNIKKAQNEGVNVYFGRDRFLIDEFINLYIQTMKKDNAYSYYYFNRNFFYTTMDELHSNSLIFAAVYKQKIIAACIIIFSEKLVHYHLAGSNIEYQSLRPNNLLIYEAAKWGAREGKELLHLGGGVSGDEDNLFRFKKSFSRSMPLAFHVGKKILNEIPYEKLVSLRAANDSDFDVNTNYFPKYRG